MELPPKPELEYSTTTGPNGEVVIGLTPESDLAYGRWLTACNMARQVIYKEMHDNDS